MYALHHLKDEICHLAR